MNQNHRPPPPAWMQGPPGNNNPNWDNTFVPRNDYHYNQNYVNNSDYQMIENRNNNAQKPVCMNKSAEEKDDRKVLANETNETKNMKASTAKKTNNIVISMSTNNDMSIISVSDSVSRIVLPSPSSRKGKRVVPACKVLKFKQDNGHVQEYHQIKTVYFFNQKSFTKQNDMFIELKPENSIADHDNNQFFLVSSAQTKKKIKF